MSAPSYSRRQKRRTVRALGKDYQAVGYKPQFALGIICRDESEQQDLHRRISQLLPGKEVKVLVI